MTKHNVYRRPQTVREYGYSEGRPVEQPGSPSGFLLGWDAIDDEAEAVAKRRPPMYLVAGEFVRPDGMRFPELVVSGNYMERAGYVRTGASQTNEDTGLQSPIWGIEDHRLRSKASA